MWTRRFGGVSLERASRRFPARPSALSFFPCLVYLLHLGPRAGAPPPYWQPQRATGRLARRVAAVVIRPGCAGAPRGTPTRRHPRSEKGEVPTVASVEERVIEIVCENLGVNKDQVT